MEDLRHDVAEHERQTGIDDAERDAEAQAEREPHLVGPNVGVETAIGPPADADRLPKRALYFLFLGSGHTIAPRGAARSASIALITCSVEMRFIGMGFCLGENSATGASCPPWRMRAGAKRGRQCNGFVGPNRTTCGVCIAADRCIGAESTVTTSRAR